MKWLQVRKLKRTTLIMLGLGAFLAGIALARTKLLIDPIVVWLCLAFIFAVYRRSQTATAVCIVLFGLSLGWWRGQSYMVEVAKYQPLYRQNVTVVGVADTDGIYNGSQLSFDLTKLQVTHPYQTELVGKVAVKGFGATAVYRGDIVQVSGNLYPTRGSRQASLSYANMAIIERSGSAVENIRHRFIAGMYNALPEPLASFGLGLLVGQRNTLPQEVSDQLSAVGLTHIVAVSGYNLTIIMLAVAVMLKGRSKYQITLLSAILIIMFLLFTGFSASIVRAAIVSGLALLAAYYGRKFRPLMLILLAAALTAGWYPIYIWSDIGWYLSFLAFFGVLIIAPLVTVRIYKVKEPKLVALVVIETICAQIMALPLIMYIFGEVSLISLVANVLIVPLVPLAMLLSFVAALGGMFVPSLAGWIAWPAKILLTYMLDLVNIMSRVPHALAPSSLPLPKLIFVYLVVISAVFALWAKTRHKNATITDITK
jgi:competence protein ComEC